MKPILAMMILVMAACAGQDSDVVSASSALNSNLMYCQPGTDTHDLCGAHQELNPDPAHPGECRIIPGDNFYGDCNTAISGIQPRRCTYCQGICANPSYGNPVVAICHGAFSVATLCASNGSQLPPQNYTCGVGNNVCMDNLPSGWGPGNAPCHSI